MAQIRSDVANISRSGDHELARSWAARILYVNGVPFVTCDRLDRGFCRYIRNRFHMTKHMKELRDMKVNALIAGLRAREPENRADPLADPLAYAGAVAPGDGAPSGNRRRRDYLRQLDRILTIEVQDGEGHEHDVRVLAPSRPQGKLVIELTQSNMDLLQLDPSISSSEEEEGRHRWVPVIDTMLARNVHWNRERCHLYARLPNADGKVTYTSRRPDMSLEFVEIQAQVHLLAQELQAEFEEARRHRKAQPVDFAIQADNDPARADVAAEADNVGVLVNMDVENVD